MVQVDRSSLSPASTIAGVARSSDSPPELVLADRPAPRLITARWRRRSTRQHPPTRLDGHLLCYRECGGAPTHRGDHLPACRSRGGGALENTAAVSHVHLYFVGGVLHPASSTSSNARSTC